MNFNFNNPYTSTRLPVFARNVVSTSHPLAAQAGLRMLLKGGNAVAFDGSDNTLTLLSGSNVQGALLLGSVDV